MPEFTDDDRAKSVVAPGGTEIGFVDRVEDGTAYVDPAEDIDSQLKMKLGWGTETKQTYPLRNDAVDEVTDEAVHIRENF